jgi:two-component system alkaline phosphatase synthesis response regulator PhoP/two-component system response regulator VicR
MAKKILVVDDERHIVRLVEVNLSRAGYDVATAYDGVEALEKVEEEHPDMIVLDVMMPRMDGFEVLKRLQADADTQDIPVIMLTAKAQDADIFRGWSSGVSSYLTKPFNPRELLTFVERIFQSMEDGGPGGGGGGDEGETVWEV